MTLKETHDEFVKKGARLAIGGTYNQKAKIETIQSAYVKSEIDGAFCGGVCMDWIRRVLLAGKKTYTTDKHLERAGHAQIALSKNAMSAFVSSGHSGFDQRKTPYQDKNKLIDTKEAQLNENMAKLRKALEINPEDPRRNTIVVAVNSLQDDVERLIGASNRNTDEIDKIEDEWKAWNNSPFMTRYWPEFTKVMNQYLNQQRTQRGKGPSRRGFDKLEVVQAVNEKQFNGMTAVMEEVMKALKVSQAVHLGILSPEGAGHAVAIHRQTTCTFFDPNFGTYEFEQIFKLKPAIAWLFGEGTGYSNIDDEHGDAHSYEVNGKVRAAYTVFAG
jgi:hypothetical protein